MRSQTPKTIMRTKVTCARPIPARAIVNFASGNTTLSIFPPLHYFPGPGPQGSAGSSSHAGQRHQSAAQQRKQSQASGCGLDQLWTLTVAELS